MKIKNSYDKIVKSLQRLNTPENYYGEFKADQVAETLTDFFIISATLEEVLADGFQPLEDLIKMFKINKEALNLIQDVVKFYNEIVTTPSEGLPQAVIIAKDAAIEELGENGLGKVTKMLIEGIYHASTSQFLIRSVWQATQVQIENWKKLTDENLDVPTLNFDNE